MRSIETWLLSLLVIGSPASSNAQPVFVPWPESVRLVDAVIGDDPADVADAGRCDGIRTIPEEDVAGWIGVIGGAIQRSLDETVALRNLAIRASDASLAPGDRAGLDARFQDRLQILDIVPQLYRIGMEIVLDSGEVVCVATPQARFPLPVLGTAGLGLTGRQISSVFDALDALPRLDTAFDSLTGLQADLRTVTLRISDGAPVGGMLEQRRLLRRLRKLARQSADGTLGAGERTMLNNAFQARIDQIDLVGTLARFAGEPLDGSTSFFPQPAPDAVGIAWTPPDLTAWGIGVAALEIRTDTSAQVALGTIDVAIARITAEIRAARRLRRQLEGR